MKRREHCAHCGTEGEVGPEIVPYSYVTPAGKKVTRWLHGIYSGKTCSAEYWLKYNAWIREQRAPDQVSLF